MSNEDIDYDALSPGIRDIVRAMRAQGWNTCDSGDGSNYENGMECARPQRHVDIQCTFIDETVATANAVWKWAKDHPELVDFPFKVQGSFFIGGGGPPMVHFFGPPAITP